MFIPAKIQLYKSSLKELCDCLESLSISESAARLQVPPLYAELLEESKSNG